MSKEIEKLKKELMLSKAMTAYEIKIEFNKNYGNEDFFVNKIVARICDKIIDANSTANEIKKKG